MSDSLRIIFAGTPDFAKRHLDALLLTNHKIVGVFTQPDRPAGRGNKLMSSAVKLLAEKHKLPVFQPPSLQSKESQHLIACLNSDVMVVVAYGLLLPTTVLEMPYFGCINVHGSLLPRWRGAAPIQRALWAGDNETGISIMQMDLGLDSGDIIHKIICPIEAMDTSASLYVKLAEFGATGLINTLKKLATGTVQREAQDDAQVTYAKKLSRKEARLNWHLSTSHLDRCIRAFNPWPVSYFIVNGQPIKVWQANVLVETVHETPGTIVHADKHGIQVATANGILNLTQLQPAGKKIMSAQDLLNARREWFIPGNLL